MSWISDWVCVPAGNRTGQLHTGHSRRRIAASSPPITPTAMSQKAIYEYTDRLVIRRMMSKMTDVASTPSGITISMG